MFEIRLAKLTDIDELTRLEKLHVNDELVTDTRQFNGSVLTDNDFSRLIASHWVVVALDKNKIIGYLIAAKWSFFGNIAIYRRMLSLLSEQGINPNNSCQYGPAWVDKKYRKMGIFSKMFAFLERQIDTGFQFLIAFIAEKNEVSFMAHTSKVAMTVVDYFEFEQQDYYLLKKALY